MPETFSEKVNRILRDHEGYTGDGQGGDGDLPTGDRSTARKPISKRDLREAFGSVEDLAIPVPSVSDMVAALELEDGYYVSTRGYTTAGDGGAATYEVMTAAAYLALSETPDDPDGSVDHELDNGLVARLLHSGDIRAEQAGAVNGVEASAQIQAAWDALVLWKNAQTDPDGANICFTHSSTCTIQNQVTLRDPSDNSRVLGCTVDFTDSHLTAVSGGDLSSSNAMLLVRLRGVQHWGRMNGGKFAAIMDMNGMSGSRSYNGRFTHGKGSIVAIRGASGSFNWYNPHVREYVQTDDEFNTDSNFTATGISIENGDLAIFGANVLFCETPIHVAAAAVQVHVVNAHIVNGNPNADGVTIMPRSEPTLVLDESTRENHWDNCYFDNGIVYDHGGTMNISGGHSVLNGRASVTGANFRIVATEPDQDLPEELRINDLGGLASVTFVDDGANTWTGDWTSLAAEFSNMAEEDRQVSYRETQFNIWPNSSANIEYNYKPAGNLLRTYRSGSDAIGLLAVPSAGEFRVNDSSDSPPANPNTVILRKTGDDRYRIWHSGRAALVSWAGSNTPDAGATVTAGGIWWVYDGTSTWITDMPGWTAYGDVYPDHFAENTTPGTTDMSAAIEAAAHMNGATGSSTSTGHTVHFRAERYAHTAVEITRDGVRLKGAGKQATRLQCLSATGDGITMGDDASKMFRPSIEDMSIGMASGVEKTSGAHVKIVRGRGGSLRNLEIDDFFDGITLEGSDRCMVYDVTGTNLARTLKCGKFISQLYHSGASEKCTDNKFTLVRSAASAVDGDAAMYIESADGCHIIGAELNNYDYALHIHTDTGNPSIGGLMCSNTYFDESHINNMRIDGDGTFQNAKFTGCYFRKASEDSIHVTSGVTVDGCMFTGSSCEAAEEMAVNWIAQASTGVMFTGHLFDDNLRDDTTTTEVYYDGDNLTLMSSNFKGGWASGVCVTLGSNSTDCVVVPNNFLATTNGTNITDNGTGNTVS